MSHQFQNMPVAEARIAEELLSPPHWASALSQASSAHGLRTQRATWYRDPRSEPKNGSERGWFPCGWRRKVDSAQTTIPENQVPGTTHLPEASLPTPIGTRSHFKTSRCFVKTPGSFTKTCREEKQTRQASLGDSLSIQQIFIDLSSSPYLTLSIRIRWDWK